MRYFLNTWIKILISFLLLIAGNMLLYAYNLPDLASNYQNILSPQQAQLLRAQFLQMLKHKLPLVHDPVVNNYVDQLGYRLVSHSPRSYLNFRFLIIKDPTINAFSGPGGIIGINSGLILKAHNESELASVISHELGHVSQFHLERNILKQKQMRIPAIGAAIASAVLGLFNPQAAAGMLSATTAGGAQYSLHYSKTFEKEADNIGMQILANSGFNPFSMPTFFSNLVKEEQSSGNQIPEFLSSHPNMSSRFANSYNRSAQYKKYNIESNPLFPLIKARLTIDLSNTPAKLAKDCRKQLQCKNINCANNKNIEKRYTYALALAKSAQIKPAKQVTQQLIKENPQQIIFRITQAQIEQQAGNSKQALKILANLYQYNPDYSPLILEYANLLIKNKRYKQAVKILEDHEIENHTADHYLSLLAQAQAKSKDLASSHQTLAHLCRLNYNKKCTKQNLEMALRYAKNDPFLTKQIQSRIQDLGSRT
jgi:beta-barrel assembly-enhancing protease